MKINHTAILSSFILAIVLVFNATICQAQARLSSHIDVKHFIHTMVTQYNFNAHQLRGLFDKTGIDYELIRKMNHPYEDQPWYVYQKLFLQKRRIDDGVLYWHHHYKALRYAATHYGVSAHIIVAIVGVESLYGEIKPKYPILSTLLTLSFAYPKRAAFFQNELVQYLLLTREMHLNPRKVCGSYAGAMGLPQFMPDSYREFAQSYKHKGFPNLFSDTNDVIVSIANFLQQQGWQRGQPIAIRARVVGHKYKNILADNVTAPQLTIAELSKYGVYPYYYNKNSKKFKISSSQKAALYELHNKNGKEYWLGFNNFYVLGKYNRHKHYVMAVFQLGWAINHIIAHQQFSKR